MFCASCGNVCPDGSTKCSSCGAVLPATSSSAPSSNPYASPYGNAGLQGGVAPMGGAKPNNNLIFAIFTTLCCCIPFGIVAIVYAAQVDSKWNQGDYNGSMQAAEKAKMWCWIALGVGILGNIIGAVLQFAIAANEFQH